MTEKIIQQSEIVNRLGQKLNNLPLEDIRLGVICLLTRMKEALTKKQTISIRGFGTFTNEEMPERTFYHPKLKVKKILKARAVARFKAGKILQDAMNKNSQQTYRCFIKRIEI
jgi:nucleoid DNA-binding protein